MSAPSAWGPAALPEAAGAGLGVQMLERALPPPAMYMEHAEPSQELQEGPGRETPPAPSCCLSSADLGTCLWDSGSPAL